jgi:uncharacterized DUF497 family protein
MRFEWDPQKNDLNLKKHGVSFEDAVQIFSDRNALSLFDEDHSLPEERWITIGNTGSGKTLVVVHTERIKTNDGFTIRLISSRRATKNEENQYYSRIKGD